MSNCIFVNGKVSSFQVVQEYERAVIFRLGRVVSGGAKGPGMTLLVFRTGWDWNPLTEHRFFPNWPRSNSVYFETLLLHRVLRISQMSKITVWKNTKNKTKQIEINTYVFYKQWHRTMHIRVVALQFHLPYDSQRSVLIAIFIVAFVHLQCF